jgi:predicted ATPase/class 3 adenylate cyclase
MNCAGCGFTLQSGFAFCPKCGAKQPIVCAGCGYLLAPDFAFCPKCGAGIADASEIPSKSGDRLSASTDHQVSGRVPVLNRAEAKRQPLFGPAKVDGHADRRTVTVLFADLSGFTTLSEGLDPEFVQTLQNDIFEEMTAAVYRFGGFPDKFIGDALLALFGAPTAHEDDPERALRAALEMIEGVKRVGERSRVRLNTPLTLHIGVNTGPVVAGGIGAGAAKSYSVTGDTVNTAQRLQSMAAPGEVLVGPLVYRLTHHAFAYESLGEASLRGKAGSVLVHRLRGPLDLPRPARGLEAVGLNAPLIGRDAELAHLIGSLSVASGGAPQLVRLIGEAGIGKTRLVDEFLARIGDDERFAEVAVRRAVCSPLGEQSFGALAAILRSAYRIERNASTAEAKTRLVEALSELGLSAEQILELTPLYCHVLDLGGPDAALPHLEAEQLRRQIFFAIRTVFERRLALSPLLVIVEDLHWADAVSLDALRFVMDRLERTRLMLVVTHRPAADIGQFNSNRISQSALRLAPLTATDGQTLLSALFGDDRARVHSLRAQILQRSGGNPLFIEEIVRNLVEIGGLRREGSQWVVAQETAFDIPANIEALLLARIDRLPDEVRRLAQEAAVIGPRFEESILKNITAERSKVESGLDVLCDAEVIEEAATAQPGVGRSYKFTQTLLRDVVYQNLLLRRRAELHERIGATLIQQHGENPERLEDAALLGHHFSLGADKLKGVRYLRAAGDRARAAYADEDAAQLYRQALEVLQTIGDRGPEWLALHERIADLCGRSGRRDAAQEYYQTALAGFRSTDDRAASARVLRKLGRLLWDGGKRNPAEQCCAEAAALLEGANAPVEQAHLLQERGRLAFRLGNHAEAVKYAEEALGYAEAATAQGEEEIGAEAALAVAEALNTKGVALARLGRTVEAVREVERSVAAAESANLLSAACRGYTNLGALYTIVDPTRAIDVCQRGLATARRIGDLGFQARLLANLAVASCTFTNKCDAEGVPAAEKAIEVDRALDQREHLPVPLIVLAQIHQCHGRPDLAVRCYKEALEVAEERREPQQLFPCYDGLATVSLDQGDEAEAERFFALAQDVCARHGLDPEGLIVLPFLD